MKPTTVAEFLAKLPADRYADVSRVREMVNQHIPAGYEASRTKPKTRRKATAHSRR